MGYIIQYNNVVVVRLHRSKDAVLFTELHRRLRSQVAVYIQLTLCCCQ